MSYAGGVGSTCSSSSQQVVYEPRTRVEPPRRFFSPLLLFSLPLLKKNTTRKKPPPNALRPGLPLFLFSLSEKGADVLVQSELNCSPTSVMARYQGRILNREQAAQIARIPNSSASYNVEIPPVFKRT